ncbi:glycosyltransferase family 2 protein [Desulfohalobiaceae bacterium Ax17]|uniref:glycosyltransferase family 2 protein n=1 Tax=Desulfovulcanus ferrireducens TaxID=2831190 RepID=UPI00207BA2B8|nr:glycosyltransferase family 2 protein [Desulfovulcanus ferrireducens]MBT8763374.1 glycosyltransferase family 2 protein [Desulfovulcanus ferrireducens]
MLEDITIIVLTFNEEKNAQACLDSIKGVTSNIFVVDSFSTDKTLEILHNYDIKYVQHEFISYSQQRNWAQKNNPFNTEWVFHLDADERFTVELKCWLEKKFNRDKQKLDGFMFSRRTVFLGKWIRFGGHYPCYHLRLYRSLLGVCEDKAYDQHFVVNGKVKNINGIDIIDTVTTDISSFINAHNKWATNEAIELVLQEQKGDITENILGNPIEKRRWLKNNLFQNAPLFLRSFIYFIYRYFFKLGFLDGKEGLIFHILQGFWFRFLVDAKVYEIYTKAGKDREMIKDYLKSEYQITLDKTITNRSQK